ncbi:MAG: DUF2288 family protein [Deltaproteobacteria bacterium]|nr:DUF2288 family protein [Deltaproteobacteria bacterium]
MREDSSLPKKPAAKLPEELKAELKDDVGTVSWSWLRPHQKRNILFLVGEQLDLLEVAVAVAEDRLEQVKLWLETGELARPTSSQVDEWERNGGLFAGIIVKPYVFFKPATVRDEG